MTKEWRRITTWALVGLSGTILVVGWILNDDRWREGPVEFVLYPGRGLHRMDLIMIALAAAPWLVILAISMWPKRGR